MSLERSRTLPPQARKMISAALRHVRDAEHLLSCSAGYASPEQAYHLAGLGPECARKATISEPWLDKVIGHGVTPWADEMVEFATALDPMAHRYDIRDFLNRYPQLARWSIESRYAETGRNSPEAVLVCRQAREIVDAIVIALWADGRLGDIED
jgi:hypothetical protein